MRMERIVDGMLNLIREISDPWLKNLRFGKLDLFTSRLANQGP
jgi:hypothetical protein